MALIVVRHIVQRPVGEAHRYLTSLAASGGAMLVGVRISDGLARAHPVLIDERRSTDADARSWWCAWSARVGIPAAAGTMTAHDVGDGSTVLEFCGSAASSEISNDVFAFRRASALARAYLCALGASIASAVAA